LVEKFRFKKSDKIVDTVTFKGVAYVEATEAAASVKKYAKKKYKDN
jgi:hypothetical protein